MKEAGIKRVAVIGAGLMGLGVGVEVARFGYPVSLYNTTKATSEQAMARAGEDLDLMVETELITAKEAKAALGRLHPTIKLEEAASGVDYVVEAVLELLPLKQKIFAQLDEICPPPAVLATNTSGLKVTDIASVVKHPERVLATHYFHPPHFVPLVEVVGGQKTDRKVIELAARVLHGLRKKVVIIDMELPGFIGNRLQGYLSREIHSLVDRGAATPAMIDDIISYGFGRRMAYTGYFKRMDMIGLDLSADVARGHGQEPWGPIAERVDRGDLGVKSGKGFYDWPGDTAKQLHRRLNMELIRLMKQDMADGSI